MREDRKGCRDLEGGKVLSLTWGRVSGFWQVVKAWVNGWKQRHIVMNLISNRFTHVVKTSLLYHGAVFLNMPLVSYVPRGISYQIFLLLLFSCPLGFSVSRGSATRFSIIIILMNNQSIIDKEGRNTRTYTKTKTKATKMKSNCKKRLNQVKWSIRIITKSFLHSGLKWNVDTYKLPHIARSSLDSIIPSPWNINTQPILP